jgi:hypothetical protein
VAFNFKTPSYTWTQKDTDQTNIFWIKILAQNTVLSGLSNKLMCFLRILSSDMNNSVDFFVCESFELWMGFLMGRYDCIKYSVST